ncbi:hypothetical protein KI809_01200 [Geobacter pelophilus]|uniref:Cysteine-rich secretory protein family protein n=1 Tax=Geoanaerobacter pelophilus TaxID=60036 RepID=A0AAW4L090_9BACT|nr:hypothetical protein [Geoanaerobacter pelophilus]MBT0662900.1 hypothetical protein [Geoanaerobacter pelophilus]
MIFKRLAVLFFVLLAFSGHSLAASITATDKSGIVTKTMLEVKPSNCLTEAEAELGRLLNGLRRESGLSPLPIKQPLYAVAKWHVIDLASNAPHRNSNDDQGMACNLHSWSDRGKDAGGWEPLCYTQDHKRALGMWKKPREISGHRSNGYENIYWTSAPFTPVMAINYWEGKKEELDMMLQQGNWKRHKWQTIGVGVYGNYAAVWFSEKPTDDPSMTQCEQLVK